MTLLLYLLPSQVQPILFVCFFVFFYTIIYTYKFPRNNVWTIFLLFMKECVCMYKYTSTILKEWEKDLGEC